MAPTARKTQDNVIRNRNIIAGAHKKQGKNSYISKKKKKKVPLERYKDDYLKRFNDVQEMKR
jgi:hypothetical protein